MPRPSWRIDAEACRQWQQQQQQQEQQQQDKDGAQLRNPLTHQRIASNGSVARLFRRVCAMTREDCAAWQQSQQQSQMPPRRGHRRPPSRTQGLAAQLQSYCQQVLAEQGSSNSNNSLQAPFSSLNNGDTDKGAAAARLRSALARAMKPFLETGLSTQMRATYARIVRRYLQSTPLNPCLFLQKEGAMMYLVRKNDRAAQKPIVRFVRRIGSASKHGEAYLNLGGHGFPRLFRFASKIIPLHDNSCFSSSAPQPDKEIAVLQAMSEMVERHRSPNMPLTYTVLRCTNNRRHGSMRKGNYALVLNELADDDLQTWLTRSYAAPVYESVLMQIVFAIYAFHNLGYLHNDCHLGNFLVHKLRPGGYWRYQVDKRDVYVPNQGWLVVLWDPGLASSSAAAHAHNNASDAWKRDYKRVLSLLYQIHKGSVHLYRDLVAPIPAAVELLIAHLRVQEEGERNYMHDLLDVVDHLLPAVQVGGRPPGVLRNVRAFTLKPDRVPVAHPAHP
jgi:hypothetical protein